jgi:hypothetical protein
MNRLLVAVVASLFCLAAFTNPILARPKGHGGGHGHHMSSGKGHPKVSKSHSSGSKSKVAKKASSKKYPKTKLAKPSKPKPGKPSAKPGIKGKVKPKKPKALGKGKKPLPKKLKGNTLSRSHKSFNAKKRHSRFGCLLWRNRLDGCWYFWAPQFDCYVWVRFIEVYPPTETGDDTTQTQTSDSIQEDN